MMLGTGDPHRTAAASSTAVPMRDPVRDGLLRFARRDLGVRLEGRERGAKRLRPRGRSEGLRVDVHHGPAPACVHLVAIVREQADTDKVRSWLNKEVLGSALQYFSDPVWRSLYWRNLLTKRQVEGRRSLVWRCDVLREAGRELLCG